MLTGYQLDRAQRNLAGYVVLGSAKTACDCGGRCSSYYAGLSGLGDISPLSPADALQQAMQAEGMSGNRDFSNPTWTASAIADVQNLQFNIAQFSPSCASQAAPSINLFSTVSGLALGTAGAGIGIADATIQGFAAGTGAILGVATMGAGVLFAVLSMIFQHHAQAVRQEQGLGCAAIAAANNSLNLIQQAVQNGQMTPATASAGLDQLQSQFNSYVAPSVGHNPCNADCELTVLLSAMVIYLKSQLAAIAAQQQAQPAPAPIVTPAPIVPAPPTSSSAAPAQPGSGSAGSGPAVVPAISSGSVLVLPPTAPAAPASSINWMAIAAVAVGAIVLTRVL